MDLLDPLFYTTNFQRHQQLFRLQRSHVMENRLNANFYNMPIRPTALPVRSSGMPVASTMAAPPLPQIRSPVNARAPPASPTSAPRPPPVNVNNNKRARKDRCPNWVHQEVLVLIGAKRDKFLQELDTIDARDLMTPENTKWLQISEEVNHAGFSPCFRDGLSYKTKWNQILPDYKRISDYLGRTGKNVRDYWDLYPAKRKEEGLLKQFHQELFDAINDWYGMRPQIQPPHVRDLLSPNDNNYRPPRHQEEVADEDTSEPDIEDPMDLPTQHAANTTENTPPRSPRSSTSTPCHPAGLSLSAATPMSTPRPALPPGITPHIISSSGTSSFSMRRRPGNTAVRRKNVSGHTIIAKATKATGEIMAQQMQDIAESSRALEHFKIEVQLKLFSEQMSYQRDKDRCLYEHVVAANENARLSILKQGEIVNCLSELSTVLGKSLPSSSSPNMSGMLQHKSNTTGTKDGGRLPDKHDRDGVEDYRNDLQDQEMPLQEGDTNA